MKATLRRRAGLFAIDRVILSVLSIVAMGGVASSIGCRKDAPAASSSVDAVDASEDDGEAARSDVDGAPRSSRTTEERAEDARRDASTDIPASCDGRALSLLASVLDERCAVTIAEWRALADGGAGEGVSAAALDASRQRGGGLRQEAKRDVDGQHVVLSVVNRGATPALVPLRFHPSHPEQAVSVIAEDERHALFELAPPAIEIPEGARNSAGVAKRKPVRQSTLVAIDAGLEKSNFVNVHSARIRLGADGGAASLRFVVDPRVVRRLDRSCGADASDCAPARLTKGTYTLHVGQLIADVDVGLPARVAWDVP